ncbi:hypothetical protein ACFYWY_34450 [Streptomyces sp. NPDC002870]|uniref:hypothetical protein n=1 Tax=Streptomyces sp. NPDC002870 TaxID=3364666 RepID=UPI0036A51BED
MAFLCHAAVIAMLHLALVGVAVGSGRPTTTLRFTALATAAAYPVVRLTVERTDASLAPWATQIFSLTGALAVAALVHWVVRGLHAQRDCEGRG